MPDIRYGCSVLYILNKREECVTLETRESFNNWIHNFGRVTTIILFLLMCAVPVVASLLYDYWPSFVVIWPPMLAMILYLSPWWPAEYFAYMTTMGPGALYMSYSIGDVSNLRMPATIGTINILGIEPGSDLCHCMAIIACGASILVTIASATIAMVASVPLTPILSSPILEPGFNNMLPALFGGLVAQTVLTKRRKDFMLYLIPLAVVLFLRYFTSIQTSFHLLIAVIVGGIVYFFFDYKSGSKTDEASVSDYIPD